MTLVSINKETCTRCGACAAACPTMIIYPPQGQGYPRQVPNTDAFCMRCGHCTAVCPTGALGHAEFPPETTPPLDKKLAVSFAQAAQLIKGRRSVREFQDKPVAREEIARIIDAARYAPTGHNAQGVRWLVITDQNKLREMAGIGLEWFRSMTAGDTPWALEMRTIAKVQESGFDVFLRRAPALVVTFAEKDNPIGTTDCVIALAYFDLAANAAGLGCCWDGYFYMSAATFPPMIEAVSLPEGMRPYGAMMVGYPKFKYARIPARRPANIIYRP